MFSIQKFVDLDKWNVLSVRKNQPFVKCICKDVLLLKVAPTHYVVIIGSDKIAVELNI